MGDNDNDTDDHVVIFLETKDRQTVEAVSQYADRIIERHNETKVVSAGQMILSQLKTMSPEDAQAVMATLLLAVCKGTAPRQTGTVLSAITLIAVGGVCSYGVPSPNDTLN